jgi:ribbon-helix-helix CopG family protein
MRTTIEIPNQLMKRIVNRARALGISRDQLIVRALERELEPGSQWRPGFFEKLGKPDPELRAAAEEMIAAIRKNRRSKKPVQFWANGFQGEFAPAYLEACNG